MANIGVHRTHCCKLHGCKYGEKSCPVAKGELKQDFPCEECDPDNVAVYTPRAMDSDDFELLRTIVNLAKIGQPYKKLLPEMKKRFKASPEFEKIVMESLGSGE